MTDKEKRGYCEYIIILSFRILKITTNFILAAPVRCCCLFAVANIINGQLTNKDLFPVTLGVKQLENKSADRCDQKLIF